MTCLTADLEESGALLVAPPRVLYRDGKVALTPESTYLAHARGTGRLILGQAEDGDIVLIRLAPDTTILLASGAFLAATEPVSATRQALGGADGWILLRAGAARSALVAIASLGAFAHFVLEAGETLDVAAKALLIVDGAVDRAVGIHADMPGRLGFVQCLGAGGIGVQAG